jgi:AcrR family transcriptional regulator
VAELDAMAASVHDGAMQGTHHAAANVTEAAGETARPEAASPRRRVGRPNAREAERKHEAMLDAALEEFSRHGFHGASVRAIAERAGLSTRTLYNRYADKVALFAACLELSALRDAWEPSGPNRTLHDDLVHFARHIQVRLNQERQVQLARVIYRECISFPQLEAVSRNQYERFQLQPARRILRFHGFEAQQAEELARVYVALVFHRWQSRVIYGERPQTPAEIERFSDYDTRLFLNGACAQRATG